MPWTTKPDIGGLLTMGVEQSGKSVRVVAEALLEDDDPAAVVGIAGALRGLAERLPARMGQFDPRTVALRGEAQLKLLRDILGLAGEPADRQAVRRLVGEHGGPYRLLARRVALEDAPAGARFDDAIDRRLHRADMVAGERPPAAEIARERLERPRRRDAHGNCLDHRRDRELRDAHSPFSSSIDFAIAASASRHMPST